MYAMYKAFQNSTRCASYVIIFRSLILIFAFVLIYYVKKTMPVQTLSIMWSLPFISLCCIILLIKINLIFLMQAWYPELICPLQASCYFTFNKSSISNLYTYFSRERESRKVSTCYRSKRAFGDLETFVIEMLGLDKDLYSRTTI
jgi:phosphoglycerol transferase MdoB-like AlkP superfamily enzyme